MYNPFRDQRGSTTTVRPSQTITLSHVAPGSHLDVADQSSDSTQDAPAEVLHVHISCDWVLSMLNTVAINRRCFALGVLTVRGRARCSVEVVSVRNFPCKFQRKTALVTCPCAFRLRRLAQNGCWGRHLVQRSCKRPLTEVLPTELW